MHAEMRVIEDSGAMETEAVREPEAGAPRVAHSLLDVLMPARPPQPKNARVIRLFDYEAAKDDPRPAQAAAQSQAQEQTDRAAAKAARKLSLFTAAGLV